LKIVQLFNNEEKLIKKAIQNNRDAQHRLYNLHAPKMLSVCRYYIKDVQFAEEVMLNGFLKVFNNLNRFKHNGSFEGWIRRIMIRESISFLRKKQQIEFATEEIEFKETEVNNVYSDMDVAEIQHLIDLLPEGYKIVFVMYAIDGYKHKEIGELLNISEGTSKSQLFKARKILQKEILKLNKVGNGTL